MDASPIMLNFFFFFCRSTVAQLVKILSEAGALEYRIIVAATACFPSNSNKMSKTFYWGTP